MEEKLLLEGEIWKEVSGFKEYFQVSNFGRVKGLKRIVGARNGKTKIVKEKILTPNSTNKKGYLTITLKRAGAKSCTFYIHRLVCTAFYPNLEDKLTVNHKDGIKSNNHVDNLEWNTYSENNTHAYTTGLQSEKGGEGNGRCKLLIEDVLSIRKLYSQGDITEQKLSNAYGVSKSTIHFILSRRSWSHI